MKKISVFALSREQVFDAKELLDTREQQFLKKGFGGHRLLFQFILWCNGARLLRGNA